MNSVTEVVIVLISFACRHLTAESAALLHAPQQLVWRTSYEQHSASAQSDTGSHSYSYSRTVQRGPDGAGYAHAEGHYSSPQGSQGFSQAHYSRGGLKNLATHLERRDKSPLEVLREEDHWCRDRLPSCRTWTHDCQKSKSVYLACPRSCGQCNSQSEQSRDLTPGQLQETVLPPEPLRQSLHPQLDSGGQLVVIEQKQQQQQQQQQSHLRHYPQQQQQQNRPRLRQQQPAEDRQLLPAPAEGLHLAQQRHPGRDGDSKVMKVFLSHPSAAQIEVPNGGHSKSFRKSEATRRMTPMTSGSLRHRVQEVQLDVDG
ncbi:hypothetical protein C0Q70_16778 [Pomacea canaliculata]|uniref:ShKT domain-containing protein n=1 Tax=Pomacea canaliculata TaxID=400727 RepID=A0A2T7NQS5_POMCA|nr:hypothetical protein C0Q70_16778 [Pomacea canaliculata]